MNLKNSQYQAIMRQYDLRQLQHRHLQSQRYQEICDRLPAYRQLEEETASFCADRARAAALGRKDVLQDMQQHLQELQEQKTLLLTQAGYPADYLEIKILSDNRALLTQNVINTEEVKLDTKWGY